MTDEERLAIFRFAVQHQFDSDPNADLVVETDDKILKSMTAVWNYESGYSDVTINPDQELVDLVRIILES